MSKIIKKLRIPFFALITAIAVFSGAFYAMQSFFSQQLQTKEQIVEDCLNQLSELKDELSTLTLESLEYEREAHIYEELSEIQEMQASIFASRFIKITCEDHRQVLGKEYFSYRDVFFVKFFFAYTDDFTVERNNDSIEVKYSADSFIAPYSVECRLISQNKVAEVTMSIEDDDHIVEIISAEQKAQASKIEDILISNLVDEAKKTDVPLIVNGTPILEWTDKCKLYPKTSIPKFDGYHVEYPTEEETE